MSPIRVATITFDWYPYEVRALRMAEAAADAGYEVDVICLGRPGEKTYEVDNGVRIYRLPSGPGMGDSLPLKMFHWCLFLILAGIKVASLHLKRSYNVVHVHNMPDFLVFSALFPKLLGAKIILDVQDVSPELMGAKAKGRLKGLVVRLATWQERASIKFAHHVVTTGTPFEQVLLRRNVPKEKITNVLNSADTKLFPAERRCPCPFDSSIEEERPFIIMYHGTLAERNGLDVAIRALALARRVVPQLRLDIQGNGEHLPVLKQLSVDLGIADHVIFTPSCSVDKLVDFVVHGDVGIIPYRCDGFANLVLPTKAYEFAWMDRPMIASDTFAIRSMFRHESIVLCDPAKPETFAEAMIDLYQHAEKRSALIANAAEDYAPYRWELSAECYQQLLASLTRKQIPERHSSKEQSVVSSEF